ncbi:hypothetical protein ACFL20_08015 [Spirochaetota bacterium]
MKVKSLTSLLIISFLVQLSCNTWSRKDWTVLKDRHFVFSSFTYSRKMHNRDIAFKFMEQFPLRAIMDKLEKTYMINIDTSIFAEFISNKDKKSIDVSGLLFDRDFNWKKKKPGHNRIEFTFAYVRSEDDPNAPFYIKEYELLLISKNRVRARFQGEVEEVSELVPVLIEKIDEVDKVKGVKIDRDFMKSKKDRKEKSNKKVDDLLRKLTPEERELMKKKLK